jgi:hypothetical protein
MTKPSKGIRFYPVEIYTVRLLGIVYAVPLDPIPPEPAIKRLAGANQAEKMSRSVLPALAFVFLLSIPAVGSTALTTIDAFDSGRYRSSDGLGNVNDNYIAGLASSTLGSTHNFFAFDLNGVSGTVSRASVRLETANIGEHGDYSVFDVTSNIDLVIRDSTRSLSIFSDLGNGNQYGQISLGPSQSTITNTGQPVLTPQAPFVDIMLSGQALPDIQATLGGSQDAMRRFVLGGSFTTPTNCDVPSSCYAFGFSGAKGDGSPFTRQLILDVLVPEPTTTALLALGLLGVAFTRKQRYRCPR